MEEERAFLSDAVPVNTLPFLTRMMAILRENKCNNFKSLPEKAKVDYRACLWVVLAQVYGQMANIDMEGEWKRLSRLVNGEGHYHEPEKGGGGIRFGRGS